MINKMIIAYIGNGKSANRYHIPYVMQRKDKIIIKKIYTPDHSQDIWDEIENVEYCQNISDILDDQDIQVVVISTPPVVHYELALKVLKARKHCVVEKPFTETYEQAKELFDYAKEHQLVLQCYQNRRFDSDFLTTQKVIESKKLGDILEVEMHYDYYRPYIPESRLEFKKLNSYIYGHGCHTLDQVVSYFGVPNSVHYDVRQLLGTGRMNDYFDLDLYYGNLKVSVKSSYFRIKSRPSFIVYGKKGMFIKEKKDKQEEDLKKFYLPDHEDFGKDQIEDYGILSYYDEIGNFHEEKVISEIGDYGRYYDALYETIVNGKAPLVKATETLEVMRILEESVKNLR